MINGALAVVLLALVSIGVALWLSPQGLRRAAAMLMARAEALEAMRRAHTDGLRHWRERLGVGEEVQERRRING